MRKNAGLKVGQEKEAIQRLLNGEVFYLHGNRIDFIEGRRNPIGITFKEEDIAHHVNREEYKALDEWEDEYNWYENIVEPILCWVSDEDKNEKCRVALINMYDRYNKVFFSECILTTFKYATPVTKEDIL